MAFKMNKPSITEGTRGHRQALKLNREMDKSSLPDGRSKSSAFQMAKKSPIEKELVGKQNNLPEGLKAKIEASPMKKGETTLIDKLKSAGKAVYKNLGKVNSASNPLSDKIARSYKKNKKEYRDKAAAEKTPAKMMKKSPTKLMGNKPANKKGYGPKTLSSSDIKARAFKKEHDKSARMKALKEDPKAKKSPAKLMRKKLKSSGATLVRVKGKKRDDTVKKAIEAAKNAKGSPDPYKNKGVYVEPKKKPVPPKKKKLTLQEANRRMS